VTLDGESTTVDYHYDYNDRLTRSTDPDIGDQVEADSWGNITTLGDDTIGYNSRNAPISIADSASTVSYTRLIDQQIVAKETVTAGATASIRYSQQGLILDTSNNVLLQVGNYGPATATFSVSTGTTSYQLTTLRGHQLLSLDSSGTATSTTPTLYDPYGVQLQPTAPTAPSTDAPTYGFEAAALVETEELAVPAVMMGARVYVPSIGLFTSQDPKPGGSLSSYNYANSDPINFSDPTGESAKTTRAFDHWWSHNFVNFWTKDIPKGWDWAFGPGEAWWHRAVGVVAIVVLVIVVVAVVYFTGVGIASFFSDGVESVASDEVIEDLDIVDSRDPAFVSYAQNVQEMAADSVQDQGVMDEATVTRVFGNMGRQAGEMWANAGWPSMDPSEGTPFEQIFNGDTGIGVSYTGDIPGLTLRVAFDQGFYAATGLSGVAFE